MYAYGKNVAKELLNSSEKIREVIVSNNFKEDSIIELIKKKKIKITFKPPKYLDQLTNSKHQGIILKLNDFVYSSLKELLANDNSSSLVLMLDHIEDPHNLGAIIRTAEAFNIDAIIIPNKRGAEVTPTVIKASAGAIYNIPIIQVSNLNATITTLKKNNYWIFGTTMDGKDINTFDYNCKACLIMGNEGKGISNLVKQNCDFLVTIPTSGKINSLNVSVATAIAVNTIITKRMVNINE
ncbi:MAG: 23S rRNA (guanosine(2251)-2'-O)-methyltransferase RlmB [bacterium]|nr:23S rRNA (guanosine(2251)-2'-O)-methyltransferase RlmB [bacterium]